MTKSEIKKENKINSETPMYHIGVLDVIQEIANDFYDAFGLEAGESYCNDIINGINKGTIEFTDNQKDGAVILMNKYRDIAQVLTSIAY